MRLTTPAGCSPPVSRRLRPQAAVVAAIALVATLGYAASGASSATSQVPEFTATELLPDSAPIEGAKSRTGRIAETDPALLGRSDSTPVNVLVKLDYDSVATYAGGVQGLAATSPKATGKKLKQNKGAVDAYESHVAGVESDIVSEIEGAVSGETVRASYRIAYGGIAMQLPANEIDDLLAVEGVVAVQRTNWHSRRRPSRPTSRERAPSGLRSAGRPRLVKVSSSVFSTPRVWPQHPSFADPGIAHPGGTFTCQFGNAGDAAFTCNDKLHRRVCLHGRVSWPWLNALQGKPRSTSRRTCAPRVTPTATERTRPRPRSVRRSPRRICSGATVAPMSGMAPGAHLIMYRVCLEPRAVQRPTRSRP